MNKQQLIQIASRNILEKRSRALDKCEKVLAFLRSKADWAEAERCLKQAQVDFVMQKIGNREQIDQLQQDLDNLTAKYKVTKDMLKPQFSCKKCSDTGYVGAKMCDCLMQEIRKLLVKDSNVDNTTFTFANSKETGKHNKAVYKKAQEICQTNCLNNVVLLGNTGTGKTYLLSACANECLSLNKSVLFVTAYGLNETFLECHLADLATKQLVMENVLDVDALFIDDLGTENIYRNVTAEYLFIVVNERIARNKQTFISTNLTLQDIRERYDERIFSRLVDKNITLLANLTGDDKRI